MSIKKHSKTKYYFSCDDAGSAYHIAAFVRNNYAKFGRKRNFVFKLGIPAIRVFKEILTAKQFLTLKFVTKAPKNTGLAIIGTGHGFEASEISKVMRCGFRVYVVFDNWTNYSSRLLYEGQRLLVTGIIVTDERAKKLAKATQPKIRVHLLSNQIVSLLKNFQKTVSKVDTKRLLLIHQPDPKNLQDIHLNQANGDLLKNILIRELTDLTHNLKMKIDLGSFDEIIVRVHPTIFSKIRNRKSIQINGYKVSQNNLIQDLSSADTIVGYNSYALFLGKKIGKQIIRIQ